MKSKQTQAASRCTEQQHVGRTIGDYYYPKIGEELGDYQPNLEFRNDDGTWVQSGLNFGRMRYDVLGFYRVNIKPNAGGEN